jgi:hypothetical protein
MGSRAVRLLGALVVLTLCTFVSYGGTLARHVSAIIAPPISRESYKGGLLPKSLVFFYDFDSTVKIHSEKIGCRDYFKTKCDKMPQIPIKSVLVLTSTPNIKVYFSLRHLQLISCCDVNFSSLYRIAIANGSKNIVLALRFMQGCSTLRID